MRLPIVCMLLVRVQQVLVLRTLRAKPSSCFLGGS